MIQFSPPTPVPSPPRRSAWRGWSANPEVRAVQIGVVATLLIHVVLLVLAPRIEGWLERDPGPAAAPDPASKEFQIEMAPDLVPPPEKPVMKFVETNPNAPDNAPDKTNNFAAQNQQVAQEKPTPDRKSDAPASKGDPTTDATALVTGQMLEPQPAAHPQAAEPETPEQAAARRLQTPLAGTEKFEGPNPDVVGANVGKPAPNALPVPERVEGAPEAKTDTGTPTVRYYKVDAKKPQPRQTLAPSVVKARPSPLLNNQFGTENIGAVAYNAKWSSYGEYLQKFIESVDVQWQRIVNQSSLYPVAGTKVVVKFRMDSTGDITEILKVDGGGGRAAQDACVSAIVARKPYGAWTDDMIAILGTSQEITFTFFYN